jgi:hypothetical protein
MSEPHLSAPKALYIIQAPVTILVVNIDFG